MSHVQTQILELYKPSFLSDYVDSQKMFIDNINKLEEYAVGIENTTKKSASLIINVKSFGALGDGVTNDTQAIINAITFAETFGGSVLIPNGIFMVSSIPIPTGTQFLGCGVFSIIKRIKNTVENPITDTAVVKLEVGAVAFYLGNFIVDGNGEQCHGIEYPDFSVSGATEYSLVKKPEFYGIGVQNLGGHGYYFGDTTKFVMSICNAREVGGAGVVHYGTDSTIQHGSFFITGLAGIVAGNNDRILNNKVFHTNQDKLYASNTYLLTEDPENKFSVILNQSAQLTGYIEEVPYSALLLRSAFNKVNCHFTSCGTGYNILDTLTVHRDDNCLVSFGVDSKHNEVHGMWGDILGNYNCKVSKTVDIGNYNVYNNTVSFTQWRSNITTFIGDDLAMPGFTHFSNDLTINNRNFRRSYLPKVIELTGWTTTTLASITQNSVSSDNLYTVNITNGLSTATTNSGIVVSKYITSDFPNLITDILNNSVDYIHIQGDVKHGLDDGVAWIGMDFQARDTVNQVTYYQGAQTGSANRNYSNGSDSIWVTTFKGMADAIRANDATVVAAGGTWEINIRFLFRATSNGSITDNTGTITIEKLKIGIGYSDRLEEIEDIGSEVIASRGTFDTLNSRLDYLNDSVDNTEDILACRISLSDLEFAQTGDGSITQRMLNAITLVGNVKREIIIPIGQHVITSNITIPDNWTLCFAIGATIESNGTAIIDFNGCKINAKYYQHLFSGNLTKFTGDIDADELSVLWFGAVRGGVVDTSVEVNATLNYCFKYRINCYIPRGKYKGNFIYTLPSDIDTLNHNDIDGEVNRRVKIRGAGLNTILTATSGIIFTLDGNVSIEKHLRCVDLESFALDGKSNNVKALAIGAIQGINMSKIDAWNCKDGGMHFTGTFDGNISKINLLGCSRAISDSDYAYAISFDYVNNLWSTNALKFNQIRAELCPCILETKGLSTNNYFSDCKFEKGSANLLVTHRPFYMRYFSDTGFSNCMFVNNHWTVELSGVEDENKQYMFLEGTNNTGSGAYLVNFDNCNFTHSPDFYGTWFNARNAYFNHCTFGGCNGLSTSPIFYLRSNTRMTNCHVRTLGGSKLLTFAGSDIHVDIDIENVNDNWNSSPFLFESGSRIELNYKFIGAGQPTNANGLFYISANYPTVATGVKNIGNNEVKSLNKNILTDTGITSINKFYDILVLTSSTFATVTNTYDGYVLTIIARDANVVLATTNNLITKTGASRTMANNEVTKFIFSGGYGYELAS